MEDWLAELAASLGRWDPTTPYLRVRAARQTTRSRVSLLAPEMSRREVRSPRVARTAVMAPRNAQPKKGVSVLA